MTVEGVDYAWAKPSISALVTAGKKFACRYGGPGSEGKQITAAELRALQAAGIAVVANAEGAAGGFRGFDAGKSWAQQAETHFRNLGMPKDRPIYFSVDWNADASDWQEIDQACDGAASVIGRNRVGIYGGYFTINHVYNAGSAKWLWQTYAWSKVNGTTKWHPGAHIRQRANGVLLDGADLDLDTAMKADYGQWGLQEDIVTPDDAKMVAAEVVKQLTTDTNFPDALGGNHNPLSDAVWDAQQIPGPDGKRIHAWQVMQAAMTAAGNTNSAVSLLQTLAARPDVDETQLASDLSAALVPHLPSGNVDAASLSEAFRILLTQAPTA